jgi:hypothetical protein
LLGTRPGAFLKREKFDYRTIAQTRGKKYCDPPSTQPSLNTKNSLTGRLMVVKTSNKFELRRVNLNVKKKQGKRRKKAI